MKRKIKILCFFTFAFFLCLCIHAGVEANSIEKIAMDIYLDSSGNAHITEVWDCKTNEGTESYHPYYNLGKSEITNLSVEENGRKYTTLPSWDTSKSLSAKAYTCGLNYISNGVEICWGISSYGYHSYTVSYTITNFVAGLTDSQMVYWTLIPYEFSSRIGQASIKVHTDFTIPDTVGVWGFGNLGGTAYVHNGNIEMHSDGSLDKREYMTILVQFPAGTFSTSNILNKDFNYYLEMAQEGSTAYKQDTDIPLQEIANSFTHIFILVILLASSCVTILKKDTLDFGPWGKKISKDVPYFRDFPCGGNLFRAYYIAYQYGILKKKTDILGAIILKWLRDSLISVEQKDSSSVFKKEDTVIVLKNTDVSAFKDEKERELFIMLKDASKDEILENKEFEKWCKNSYTKILSWFDEIIDNEQDKLLAEGLITKRKKSWKNILSSKKYTVSASLHDMALEIAGLKRFLLDYSLIHEREALEVHLFEDYLIFAQMLGIAKTVAKQFKELYPEVIESSCYNSYDNIMFIYMCSYSGVSMAESARSAAQRYSSGGGGFSSGGGGGGSFGGGGGGGGFR